MRILKFVALPMLIIILAAACMPVQAPADDGATVARINSAIVANDAMDAQNGPYATGYTPVVIGAESKQPLNADLWYPALNPAGAQEEITYDVTVKMAEMQGDFPAVVYGEALLDAPIDESAAPYPLILFSHGFGLNAAAYHTLAEHYATHGFVVLAPDHMEDDWFDGVETTISRPLDIKRALDFAEGMNASDGELAGLIDMDNVAVAGHSYGGYTALAAAGARLDFDALNERCGALSEDAPEMFLCAPLMGKEAELATRAGLNSVPDGLWPSMGDPRVSAILTMAGDAYMFGETGLGEVKLPMMVIGGTADTGTPFDWGSGLSYEAAASAQKSLVGLEGAEHMIVASPCDDIPWLAGSPYADYLCVDPAWDKDQALDLVSHFSTAFLLDALRGDADARASLLPNAVDFAGIYYHTTLQ